MASACVSVRIANIDSAPDSSFTPAPLLSRLVRKTALFIVSGLGLRSLEIPEFRSESGERNYPLATHDGESSNTMESKFLVSGMSLFKNIIVVICPRFCHLESSDVVLVTPPSPRYQY